MHFAIGAADGIFGPLTEEAVTGFQLVVGLETDGIVGPLTQGELAADSWAALEPFYTALGTLNATETATAHTIETVLDFAASWQILASDRYATPSANRAIDAAISDFLAKARRRAFRSTEDTVSYTAPNAVDLDAPSLGSIAMLVSEYPPPSGWVLPLRVDLAADALLAPAELFMPGVDFPSVLHPFAQASLGVDPARYAPTYENYDLLALRPDRLRIYFDPGHLKMEHAGIQHLDVSYSGLTGSIRPSIVARANSGLTVESPAGPMPT
jgi:hypothetical protein